jgi:hypothetical protein
MRHIVRGVDEIRLVVQSRDGRTVKRAVGQVEKADADWLVNGAHVPYVSREV